MSVKDHPESAYRCEPTHPNCGPDKKERGSEHHNSSLFASSSRCHTFPTMMDWAQRLWDTTNSPKLVLVRYLVSAMEKVTKKSHALYCFETESLSPSLSLWLPGLCLSLPPQHWDHKAWATMPGSFFGFDFKRDLGLEFRSCCLKGNHFTDWAKCPAPT